MTGAVTTAAKRALSRGQNLGLTGPALREYILITSGAVGHVIDEVIREAALPRFHMKVGADGSCVVPVEAMRAAGLPLNTSLPIEVDDGLLVIGAAQ